MILSILHQTPTPGVIDFVMDKDKSTHSTIILCIKAQEGNKFLLCFKKRVSQQNQFNSILFFLLYFRFMKNNLDLLAAFN